MKFPLCLPFKRQPNLHMHTHLHKPITLNILLVLSLCFCHSVSANKGKIIATAGLVQIEGSGGGGIVPWATINGYESRSSISTSVTYTQVSVDDFRLDSTSIALGLYDRVELSLARQKFTVQPLSVDLNQNIYGLKVRLYGDLIYSDLPQISAGIQYKKLDDGTIANALGAKKNDKGTDFYLAATKVHLGIAAGYNLIWNLTARATKANQIGLLGYSGINNDNYEIMLEASIGVLFSRHLAVGAEYRQKPNNLAVKEDDWYDLFITYIPNKNMHLTFAWANLGTIAGTEKQHGIYGSLTGYF